MHTCVEMIVRDVSVALVCDFDSPVRLYRSEEYLHSWDYTPYPAYERKLTIADVNIEIEKPEIDESKADVPDLDELANVLRMQLASGLMSIHQDVRLLLGF